eukprot:2373381-Rhodomonas_salina.5
MCIRDRIGAPPEDVVQEVMVVAWPQHTVCQPRIQHSKGPAHSRAAVHRAHPALGSVQVSSGHRGAKERGGLRPPCCTHAAIVAACALLSLAVSYPRSVPA